LRTGYRIAIALAAAALRGPGHGQGSRDLLAPGAAIAALARRQLKRGVFPSVIALQETIQRFIAAHNREPNRLSGKPIPRPSSPPPKEDAKR
jgi:hypothetical protein